MSCLLPISSAKLLPSAANISANDCCNGRVLSSHIFTTSICSSDRNGFISGYAANVSAKVLSISITLFVSGFVGSVLNIIFGAPGLRLE